MTGGDPAHGRALDKCMKNRREQGKIIRFTVNKRLFTDYRVIYFGEKTATAHLFANLTQEIHINNIVPPRFIYNPPSTGGVLSYGAGDPITVALTPITRR